MLSQCFLTGPCDFLIFSDDFLIPYSIVWKQPCFLSVFWDRDFLGRIFVDFCDIVGVTFGLFLETF